eukprot:363259-Chlamydomonas_euryale.AAC.7
MTARTGAGKCRCGAAVAAGHVGRAGDTHPGIMSRSCDATEAAMQAIARASSAAKRACRARVWLLMMLGDTWTGASAQATTATCVDWHAGRSAAVECAAGGVDVDGVKTAGLVDGVDSSPPDRGALVV